MHAKRSPIDPPLDDPSSAPTREVDSVSELAAELLLSERDEVESGRREKAARPDSSPAPWPTPSPSPPPSRASLRDSLLPDEPSRSTRTIVIAGAVVALALVLGAVAFLLAR